MSEKKIRMSVEHDINGKIFVSFKQSHYCDDFGENGECEFHCENGVSLRSSEVPQNIWPSIYVGGSEVRRRNDKIQLNSTDELDFLSAAIEEYNDFFKSNSKIDKIVIALVDSLSEDGKECYRRLGEYWGQRNVNDIIIILNELISKLEGK